MNRFEREMQAADDRLCDQIRDDFLELRHDFDARVSIMRRWIENHPSIIHRVAALDELIRCTLDGADSRSDGARTLREEFPQLSDAIDAAMFLDSVFAEEHQTESPPVAPRPGVLPISVPGADGSPRYDLLRVIDEGADGRIYFAVDRLLGSSSCAAPIAVKAFRDATRTDVQSLIDEARRARRVHHPAVIRVYDAGVDARIGPYIVFEHCEGEPLSRIAGAGRRLEDRATTLRLFATIARAVGAIHRSGVSHGDLHPGNVIINRDGQPRVIDLGVGRSLMRPHINSAIGSLGFTAPESITSERIADGQPADVYSIGAMLFWVLTGASPHGDTVDALERWIAGDGAAGRPDQHSRIRKFDAQTAHVIRRALSRDPADRHPSADDLANDFDRCRRFEPITWAKPSAVRRLTLAYRRSPRSWISGSVLVAFSVLAVVAAVLIQSRARVVESTMSLDVARAELAANNAALAAANSELAGARQAQSIATAVQRFVRAASTNSPNLRWLIPLLLLESPAIGDPATINLLSTDQIEERIEMLRAIIATQAENPEHELQRIIAMGLLATWLDAAGRHDEARGVAAAAAEALRTFDGDRSSEMQALRAILKDTPTDTAVTTKQTTR